MNHFIALLFFLIFVPFLYSQQKDLIISSHYLGGKPIVNDTFEVYINHVLSNTGITDTTGRIYIKLPGNSLNDTIIVWQISQGRNMLFINKEESQNYYLEFKTPRQLVDDFDKGTIFFRKTAISNFNIDTAKLADLLNSNPDFKITFLIGKPKRLYKNRIKQILTQLPAFHRKVSFQYSKTLKENTASFFIISR